MFIPNQLKKNILNIYGNSGQIWLDNLSHLIKVFEINESIKVSDCYPEASFNFVSLATFNDGTKVVFKCSVPNKSLSQEADALRHYDGLGCVKILYFDNDTGMMLLEKATPGELLESCQVTDEISCGYAVDVMHRLHKPLSDNTHFPTLHDWFKGFEMLRHRFNGKTGPFPEKLIDAAQKISNELLISQINTVLLHGDLHYANILSSNKHGWIAIDPKGVIGEPEFEIPLPRLGKKVNKKTVEYNIDCFIAISGLDRQRILNWFFAKVALAAWWSFEDSGKISIPFLQCAEYVAEMID